MTDQRAGEERVAMADRLVQDVGDEDLLRAVAHALWQVRDRPQKDSWDEARLFVRSLSYEGFAVGRSEGAGSR